MSEIEKLNREIGQLTAKIKILRIKLRKITNNYSEYLVVRTQLNSAINLKNQAKIKLKSILAKQKLQIRM